MGLFSGKKDNEDFERVVKRMRWNSDRMEHRNKRFGFFVDMCLRTDLATAKAALEELDKMFPEPTEDKSE